MKREYMKPGMREVTLRSKPLLETGSNFSRNSNVEMDVVYGQEDI